jgi:hypothetical protein
VKKHREKPLKFAFFVQNLKIWIIKGKKKINVAEGKVPGTLFLNCYWPFFEL